MDRKPDRFPLPDHLPPGAALALFDCLSDLLDAVWKRYEPVLLEQILHDQNAPPDHNLDPEFDDEIPF